MPGEVLLVEDNPADINLTLLALAQHHLESHVKIITDAEQAILTVLNTSSLKVHMGARITRGRDSWNAS